MSVVSPPRHRSPLHDGSLFQPRRPAFWIYLAILAATGSVLFGEQSFFATRFQSIHCKLNSAICKVVLFGGEIELRQRFINLGAANDVAQVVEEFARALEMNLRLVKSVQG